MSETLPPPPQPKLDGQELRIAVLVARYNWSITGAMLLLAKKELLRLGVAERDIFIGFVPGSYELPFAAHMMASSGDYEAVICLGCIMKGETRHDVIIGDSVAQNLQRVAIENGIPVILGVMCAENQDQAEARIPRGTECARSAVEMARFNLDSDWPN